MSELIRFGVSMDKDLVNLLDEYTHSYNFPNRSHTIRHMIHEHLSELNTDEEESMVTSVISLIYKAGRSLERVPITPYPSLSILTNLQSHLSESAILKIMVIQGKAKEIRTWAYEVMKDRHVIGKISIVAPDTMVQELL